MISMSVGCPSAYKKITSTFTSTTFIYQRSAVNLQTQNILRICSPHIFGENLKKQKKTRGGGSLGVVNVMSFHPANLGLDGWMLVTGRAYS